MLEIIINDKDVMFSGTHGSVDNNSTDKIVLTS